MKLWTNQQTDLDKSIPSLQQNCFEANPCSDLKKKNQNSLWQIPIQLLMSTKQPLTDPHMDILTNSNAIFF